MSVLCRLKVGSVIPFGDSSTVNLYALHSPDDVEDDETLAEIRSFFQATPSANFSMVIANQAAAEQFQQGDEFYVNLTKIPTDKTVAAIYAARSEAFRKEQEAGE